MLYKYKDIISWLYISYCKSFPSEWSSLSSFLLSCVSFVYLKIYISGVMCWSDDSKNKRLHIWSEIAFFVTFFFLHFILICKTIVTCVCIMCKRFTTKLSSLKVFRAILEPLLVLQQIQPQFLHLLLRLHLNQTSHLNNTHSTCYTLKEIAWCSFYSTKPHYLALSPSAISFQAFPIPNKCAKGISCSPNSPMFTQLSDHSFSST